MHSTSHMRTEYIFLRNPIQLQCEIAPIVWLVNRAEFRENVSALVDRAIAPIVNCLCLHTHTLRTMLMLTAIAQLWRMHIAWH